MKKKIFILLIPVIIVIAAFSCSGGGSSGDSTGDPVYSVSVNGTAVPVVRVSNFDIPVNYVKFIYPGSSCTVQITVNGSLVGYTLSPASKNIGETVSGNTIEFDIDVPQYLILQVPGKERLCILIDPSETAPPEIGDAGVVSIMAYDGIDNTGTTDITTIIQGAINDLEGSGKILYFPAGIYYTNWLYLKDDMTVYLAEGATLKCATQQGSLMSHPADQTLIEGCSRGFINMNGVTNAVLKGRGVLDANGAYLRSFNRKMFSVKIENSSNCIVEGILSLDSCFWNTLIYRSDSIEITNYKVINNRLDDTHNETDGVDFDNCTNSGLYNAFLYTGDDCMAVKSDDIDDANVPSGALDPTTDSNYINVNNISHEKIVCFSGSAACKVGTKTYGETMSNISFTDIDVITANRGLVIDAVDTAQITGTVFEDIRIENLTGRLVDFNMDPEAIYWRIVKGECSVDNTSVINVSSAVDAASRIMGNDFSGVDHYIDNTAFTNFSVGGSVILDINDGNFSINEQATNITFTSTP